MLQPAEGLRVIHPPAQSWWDITLVSPWSWHGAGLPICPCKTCLAGRGRREAVSGYSSAARPPRSVRPPTSPPCLTLVFGLSLPPATAPFTLPYLAASEWTNSALRISKGNPWPCDSTAPRQWSPSRLVCNKQVLPPAVLLRCSQTRMATPPRLHHWARPALTAPNHSSLVPGIAQGFACTMKPGGLVRTTYPSPLLATIFWCLLFRQSSHCALLAVVPGERGFAVRALESEVAKREGNTKNRLRMPKGSHLFKIFASLFDFSYKFTVDNICTGSI